jgi:hypothetical protein
LGGVTDLLLVSLLCDVIRGLVVTLLSHRVVLAVIPLLFILHAWPQTARTHARTRTSQACIGLTHQPPATAAAQTSACGQAGRDYGLLLFAEFGHHLQLEGHHERRACDGRFLQHRR